MAVDTKISSGGYSHVTFKSSMMGNNNTTKEERVSEF